jgi:hypothetical protein
MPTLIPKTSGPALSSTPLLPPSIPSSSPNSLASLLPQESDVLPLIFLHQIHESALNVSTLNMLTNGSIVNISEVGDDLTICVEPFHDTIVDKIQFIFDESEVSLDTSAPFCIDNEPHLKFPKLSVLGVHKITVQVFFGEGLSSSPPLTVVFHVVGDWLNRKDRRSLTYTQSLKRGSLLDGIQNCTFRGIC